MNPIFRPSAVERLSTPDRLDQPLAATGPLGWLALTVLGLAVAVAVATSLVVTVPVKVPSSGILLSTVGLLEIPIETSGRLAEVLVGPGDRVSARQVVARLELPDLRREVDRSVAELADAEGERARLADFHARSQASQARIDAERRRGLEQNLVFVRQRLAYFREREGLVGNLVGRQIVTQQRLIETQIEIGRAEEDIFNAERAGKQMELEALTARIQAEREVLAVELKIAAAVRRRDGLAEKLARSQEIVSPYDGVVGEVRYDGRALVQQGTVLMVLLPTDASDAAPAHDLVAALYVSGADGKKITSGMTVEITPSTVRREEFGFMTGRVRRVSPLPSTEEGMVRTLKNRQLAASLQAGGAPFGIEVDLDRDAATPTGYRWSSSTGPATTITPGTLARGEVWVRRLRLAEIAIPALQWLFRDSR